MRLAREEVELAREWGRPRAIGQALRAAGIVEDDVELLREAVAVLDGSPARLARGKALVALGSALRDEEILSEGLELARAMRAAGLAAQAEAQLEELGVDVPPVPTTGFEALGASERRIAAFAAEGLGVGEIAQTLFLTPATVEEYLARARRTLGVDTNEELVRAVSSSAATTTAAPGG